MKHLQIFETGDAFEAGKAKLEKPWVVLTDDDKNVHIMESGEPTPTYEYVDLGLPSGLKWAKCNIGATSETDYGLYFQWGATEGYTAEQIENGEKVFDWKTTPYQTNKSADDSSGAVKFTKYLGSTSSEYKDSSATDEDAMKTVLDPIDDAATQLMGKDWRMPTADDFIELLEGTTNVWVDNYNNSGINGRLFTSKTNNNTLFIPASGYASGTGVDSRGSLGYCWSSSLLTSSSDLGHSLYFYSGYVNPQNDYLYRYYGFCVRSVSEN